MHSVPDPNYLQFRLDHAGILHQLVAPSVDPLGPLHKHGHPLKLGLPDLLDMNLVRTLQPTLISFLII